MGKKTKTKADGLSKRERRELEEREAALAAELARREAAKAGKKKKGGKGKKGKAAAQGKPATPPTAEERKAKSPSAKADIEAASRRVLADENASEGARTMAETSAEAAAEAAPEETDAQIKERVKAKRAARAAAAVIEGKVDAPKSEAHKALDAIIETTGKGPKPETVAKVKDAVEALKSEVEELETEEGRIFEAGAPNEGEAEASADRGDEKLRVLDAERDAVFANPSDADRLDFETNGLGQYKIARPSDGKLVGYTRWTTYIDALDNKTKLTDWKLRILLEGVALNDTTATEDGRFDPVVGQVRDLIHRRDVAIAKARKQDRKGKLVPGQLATLVDGAWADFKRAMDALAESMLDLGGAHEKAQKGTDLHALTELHDREGIGAVGELLTEGKITPTDMADVEAYAEAIAKAGIRILPEHIEQVVVNDELKVAGRLDRIAMVKLPGEARARRRVVDVKTGRIDYSTGKLAQQIEGYSSSVGYDLETHERTDLKVDRTKGIVVHVPAGTGKAFVYPVDLTLGRKGNGIVAHVRAFRNEGKRAVDFKAGPVAEGGVGHVG